MQRAALVSVRNCAQHRKREGSNIPPSPAQFTAGFAQQALVRNEKQTTSKKNPITHLELPMIPELTKPY
jgi:hypothetical protein